MDLKSVVESVNKVVGAADEYITKAVRKGEEVYAHVTADAKSNVTVSTNENEFRMVVALPGYSKDDLAVKSMSGKLIVTAKHRDGMPTHGLEFFGDKDPKFSTVLPLGARIADASANLKDGILTIVIPLDENEVHPVAIEVE